MKRQRKPLPRGAPPKRSTQRIEPNKGRKAKAFSRAYGSKDRVEWVKSLPCVACGVEGYSECAHIGSGGAGRKADASKIIPLCGPRFLDKGDWKGQWVEGCHKRLHTWGRVKFAALYSSRGRLDLDQLAARMEQLWLTHLQETAP